MGAGQKSRAAAGEQQHHHQTNGGTHAAPAPAPERSARAAREKLTAAAGKTAALTQPGAHNMPAAPQTAAKKLAAPAGAAAAAAAMLRKQRTAPVPKAAAEKLKAPKTPTAAAIVAGKRQRGLEADEADGSNGSAGPKRMKVPSDASTCANDSAALQRRAPRAAAASKAGKARVKARAAGAGAKSGPAPERAAQPAGPAPLLKAAGPRAFSSNWQAIKSAVGATGAGKQYAAEKAAAAAAGGGGGAAGAAMAAARQIGSKGCRMGPTPVVAMDCEMVGVGPDGVRSALARVCLVNDDGNVLMDSHVRPKERVTDFRTWVSGVKPEHLFGEGVLTLEEAQAKVTDLLKGSVLVGHALRNDLKALLLDHPRKDTRDTARYPPLMRSPAPGRKPRPRALRHLAREELGLTIQDGSHSPVDDARAALYIYHKHRREWERDLASGALARTAAQKRGLRKAVRDTLRDGAINAGAARRARLGRCKGQVKAAAALAAKARCGGAADAYTRDARDDPAADL